MVEGVVVVVPFLQTNSPGPIPENSCLLSAQGLGLGWGLWFRIYGLWFKV